MTENHVLQLVPGGVPLVLHVSQYDADRSYVFTPYYGAVKYEKEQGAAVALEATKPDSTVVAITPSYNEDGTISLDLPAALTQAAGDARAKLVILDENGKRIASAKIIFAVDVAGIDTYARVSESDLEILHEAEKKMINLEDNMRKAEASASAAAQSEKNAGASATAASTSADAASKSANAASESQTTAASSAKTASDAASSAIASQKVAEQSASAASDSATAAGKSATAAANSEENASSAATRAESAAKKAESVSAVSIATTDNAGIVKPDGNTISVAEDGTIKAASVTFDETTGDLYMEL